MGKVTKKKFKNISITEVTIIENDLPPPKQNLKSINTVDCKDFCPIHTSTEIIDISDDEYNYTLNQVPSEIKGMINNEEDCIINMTDVNGLKQKKKVNKNMYHDVFYQTKCIPKKNFEIVTLDTDEEEQSIKKSTVRNNLKEYHSFSNRTKKIIKKRHNKTVRYNKLLKNIRNSPFKLNELCFNPQNVLQPSNYRKPIKNVKAPSVPSQEPSNISRVLINNTTNTPPVYTVPPVNNSPPICTVPLINNSPSIFTAPLVNNEQYICTNTPAERTNTLSINAVSIVNNKTPYTEPLNPPRRLRPIYIDGLNIGHAYGHGTFEIRGIELCIEYFAHRGHSDILVFIPTHRQGPPGSRSRSVLNELYKKGLVCYTPSRKINDIRMTCYDDRIILNLAVKSGAAVVSNDNYRDLYEENPEFREVIETRHVMVTFARDTIIVPDDQYNCRDFTINLSDILCFPIILECLGLFDDNGDKPDRRTVLNFLEHGGSYKYMLSGYHTGKIYNSLYQLIYILTSYVPERWNVRHYSFIY